MPLLTPVLTSVLTPAEKRALRAKAHHLTPVVIIGQHGLTPPVQHEIDVALLAHELIKVRVHGDDRGARETVAAAICAALACEDVQHLGKTLVLWRANPDKTTGRAKSAASKAPLRKMARKSTDAAHGSSRDDASSRRRLRDQKGSTAKGNARGAAKGKAAPVAALPYFSRRGAGRFVAATADATPAAKAPAGARNPAPAGMRRSMAPTPGKYDAPPTGKTRVAAQGEPRPATPGTPRPATSGKPRSGRGSAISPPRTSTAKIARRRRQG